MNNFNEESRVWVYMSNRPFTGDESDSIEAALTEFCRDWTAHGSQLHAEGEVRYNQFIVLMVDESAAGASGCSIDKSVHFIQTIERKYQVQLFNRLLVGWMNGNSIQVAPLNQLQQYIDSNVLRDETLVFNNAVTTKKELDKNWMLPFSKSWLASRFRSVQNTNR